MVKGVTKSSGQGGTGVLAPIRECPPGGWRGKKERGKDREGEGEPKGPHQYNLTRGEETKISIVEKLKQQSVRSQFDCNFWKKIPCLCIGEKMNYVCTNWKNDFVSRNFVAKIRNRHKDQLDADVRSFYQIICRY